MGLTGDVTDTESLFAQPTPQTAETWCTGVEAGKCKVKVPQVQQLLSVCSHEVAHFSVFFHELGENPLCTCIYVGFPAAE